MRVTRVLLVCADLYHMTGYTNALKEIAVNLAELGEEVLLLDSYYCPYTPRIPPLRKKVAQLGKANVLAKHFSARIAGSALLHWREDAGRIRPYTDGVGSAIQRLRNRFNYSYTKRYAIKLIKDYQPSVVHIHGFTLELLPFYDAVMELGMPFVATGHGVYSFDPNIELWFNRKLEEDLFNAISHKGYPITVVSSKVKENAIRGFDIPESAVHIVMNGIDTDRFKPAPTGEKAALREKYGVGEGKTVLLTVASIQKRKNQKAVLEALSFMGKEKRADLVYLMVGAGDLPTIQEYTEYIKTSALQEQVRIIGRVSDEDLQDYYHMADIFILTSTSEAFGLVFLEAMATGLPVISYSDLEGIQALFDIEAMLLSSSRSPNSMVAAIIDAKTKEWNGKKIRRHAESWNWKAICEQYMKVYEEAISVSKNMNKIDLASDPSNQEL